MSQTFELTVLGTGSATPTLRRNPSAQVLNVRDKLYLIDCGEGTQLALRKNKIKFQSIEHVFISHLHGDHYLGLQGLLSTFSLLGRSKELHIYSPKGLQEIIDLQFKLSGSISVFPIHFHVVSCNEAYQILENEHLSVQAFPLKHRIECYGYLFREKAKLRHINGPLVKELQIPYFAYPHLKAGMDYKDEYNGKIYKADKLTFPADPSYSFAYCSDTAYLAQIIDVIKGVDLLYHESTFMQKDQALAEKTLHSTSIEAATIAQKAGVKTLLLGHYSSRYDDLRPLLEECKSVFENTILCDDGEVIKLS
jgi:ribonuclease Z